MSLDGEEDWAVFNRGNSTVAADQAYDLALDERRGVVWAATEGGLSTLALAPVGGAGSGRLKLAVRPNPWYPERSPLLAVSGMPRYSKVWILTVNGEEVRRFQPQDRAPDGRTFIGKVALLR